MIHSAVSYIEEEAERIAASGNVDECLASLRRLGLDDFGLFFLRLPDERYPKLSKILPRTASVDAQKAWTGRHGVDLLTTTVSFVRALDSVAWQLTGRGLQNRRILDFACGYGRIIRLMYYFTNPSNIIGIDAWNRSLEVCKADGVLATFALSDEVPTHLPVDGKVEVAYAFSILTHLNEAAASAVLAALREAVTGFLAVTVRPVEFWDYFATRNEGVPVDELKESHENRLFAHLPHANRQHYGDTSIHFDYLKRLRDWEFVCYDRMLVDPYQTIVILRPR